MSDMNIVVPTEDVPDGFVTLAGKDRPGNANLENNYEYVMHDTGGNRISVGIGEIADALVLVYQGIGPAGLAPIIAGIASDPEISLAELSVAQARELANALNAAADAVEKHSGDYKTAIVPPWDDEYSVHAYEVISGVTGTKEERRQLIVEINDILGERGDQIREGKPFSDDDMGDMDELLGMLMAMMNEDSPLPYGDSDDLGDFDLRALF